MTGEELPKARVRRRRLFNLAWIIPIVAAAVAGWLIWQRMQERGPEITITLQRRRRPARGHHPGEVSRRDRRRGERRRAQRRT